MTTAQLAAVSYLARYSGRTHTLYAYQLQQWFAWCESNGLGPLIGIQRREPDSAGSSCSVSKRSPLGLLEKRRCNYSP